jgi:hypothetical protein
MQMDLGLMGELKEQARPILGQSGLSAAIDRRIKIGILGTIPLIHGD